MAGFVYRVQVAQPTPGQCIHSSSPLLTGVALSRLGTAYPPPFFRSEYSEHEHMGEWCDALTKKGIKITRTSWDVTCRARQDEPSGMRRRQESWG